MGLEPLPLVRCRSAVSINSLTPSARRILDGFFFDRVGPYRIHDMQVQVFGALTQASGLKSDLATTDCWAQSTLSPSGSNPHSTENNAAIWTCPLPKPSAISYSVGRVCIQCPIRIQSIPRWRHFGACKVSITFSPGSQEA